jgi:methionyl-tRNA formyltransferase
MNAQLWSLTSGVNGLRCAAHLRQDFPSRARVAVFGSFYGVFRVLSELLEPPLAELVTVVGVATDDPMQPFTHADVRLWKYPHTPAEEEMVLTLARENELPVYRERVKTPDFERIFMEQWKPDLCLMATFGQKIPRSIFEVPRLGFFNFHHSDEVWPSYPGPDPIAGMVRDGKTHVVITMHEVTEILDGGAALARSHKVPLPLDANAVKVHRLTWPQMGGFIKNAVDEILDAEKIRQDETDSWTMHEEPASYFAEERPLGQCPRAMVG